MASQRMYVLDLVRFIAMLFMVQGHVLDALLPDTVTHADTLLWNVWNWIRGLTAPVFLVVSGASHVFAAKRGESGMIRQDIIQRRIRMACTLVGIGYLLVLPGRRLFDLPYVSVESWKQSLIVNILQLIGVTLIVFMLVMERTRSIEQMRTRAMSWFTIILVLSPIMHWDAVHQHLPTWLRPYLTMQYGSIFPFFPTGAYMFAGAFIGSFIASMTDEQRLRWLRRVGLRIALPASLTLVVIQQYLLMQGVRWQLVSSADSELLVLQRTMLAITALAICTWVLQLCWKYRSIFVIYGRKGLYIYVIHLVLLFGTPWWDGVGRTQAGTYSIASALGMLIVILGGTLVVTYLIHRYENANLSTRSRSNVRRILLGALIAQLVLGL